MEYLCPLCNSLERVEVRCDACGEIMEDKGPIHEYFDDYSPYLDMHITRKIDGAPHDQCVHLFFCQKCNSLREVSINMVEY